MKKTSTDRRRAFFNTSTSQNILCVLFSALLVCTVLFTCACDYIPTYYGENEPLAAAAIYSVPGITSSSGDKFLELERDEFGRVLFAMSTHYSRLSKSPDLLLPAIVSVIIVQSYDDNHVFFYGEENYIFKLFSDLPSLTEENVKKYFSDEDIEALKAVNHWGISPEESFRTLVKAPITTKKEDSIPDSAIELLEEKIGKNVSYVPFREDLTGKKSYFICNTINDYKTNSTEYEWYLVVFDDNWKLLDDNAGLLQLQQTEVIGDQIAAFFTQIGWADQSTEDKETVCVNPSKKLQ